MSLTTSELISDLAYGLRQMWKNPSMTVLSVIVLAIGIGATTAVFTVLNDVLLKPLPYRDADRIAFVHNEFPSSPLGRAGVSAPDYAELTAHREIFAETAAYYFNDFTMNSVGGSGYAEHVDVVNASASLFSLLGIQAQLGRTLLSDDDRYGAPRVVVLSDALWRTKFNADPHVVGRTIQLESEPYQIIGVMPPNFNFPHRATQMWVPLALRPEAYAPDARGNKWLQMLARIAPRLAPERAKAVLAAVSHRVAMDDPDSYPERSGWHFSFEPMLAEQTKDVRQWLLLAFGAVICVLLIACINVSGLLLVRATARSREWAVRAALGASPGRLIQQMLAETSVLAAIGCGAGLGLAIAFVRLINTFGPIHGTELQPSALMFAFGLCVMSTLVAGLLPAVLSSRVPLEQALRSGAGRTTTGLSQWRGALVAGQISIAVGLLFTATALERSFVKLLEVSPGFAAEGVWTASVGLPRKAYATGASHAAFFRNLVDRIAALPGVESASAGLALPFSSGGYTADMFIPGRPEPRVRPAAGVNVVLPNYFETMKIPLLRGRTFTAHDDANSHAVVIIDEEFARRYFPGEDPIGKLAANNGSGFPGSRSDPARIIGVVGNVSVRELGALHRPEIYWPQLQLPNSAMFIVVREAGQTDVTSAVRELLRQQDREVALFDIETMPQRIMDSVKLRRFVAWLLSSFALGGAVLAALGLYGTLAYLVQLRRREIAIRVSLGASGSDVARLVARHSLSLALAGLIPGVLLCALSARATRSFLFGVAPLDVWTVAPTVGGLILLVAIATWPPVARASGVNALSMLREE